ncbi:MAG: hypothetical protein ACI35R_06645 [Bacillus sp. (in: firmicutes)]
MTTVEIIDVLGNVFYIAGYGSFLLIPYWMCMYFSHEKKKSAKS